MNIRSTLATLVALAGLSFLPLSAQSARGLQSGQGLPNQGIANNPTQVQPRGQGGGGPNVPTNSPEPLTLIALGSGAALASGAAYRRRKRKQA